MRRVWIRWRVGRWWSLWHMVRPRALAADVRVVTIRDSPGNVRYILGAGPIRADERLACGMPMPRRGDPTIERVERDDPPPMHCEWCYRHYVAERVPPRGAPSSSGTTGRAGTRGRGPRRPGLAFPDEGQPLSSPSRR